METKKRNPNWGGKRPGSGRKSIGVKRVVVYLSPEQHAHMYGIGGGNVSAAMRQLIQKATGIQ